MFRSFAVPISYGSRKLGPRARGEVEAPHVRERHVLRRRRARDPTVQREYAVRGHLNTQARRLVASRTTSHYETVGES